LRIIAKSCSSCCTVIQQHFTSSCEERVRQSNLFQFLATFSILVFTFYSSSIICLGLRNWKKNHSKGMAKMLRSKLCWINELQPHFNFYIFFHSQIPWTDLLCFSLKTMNLLYYPKFLVLVLLPCHLQWSMISVFITTNAL
jgi:hypothetical protein